MVASTNTAKYVVDPAFGVVTDMEPVTTDAEPSDGYGEISGSSLHSISTEFSNGLYGVVTEVENSYSTDKFGFITEVKDHVVKGMYGITTMVANLDDTFKVYYVSTPSKLKFNEAILVLPERWEDLLLRYVVGTALQDDNDANNITRGEAELQKYEKKLGTIREMSSKDFSSSASDKLETNFRRI